jgi:hypothetical protein
MWNRSASSGISSRNMWLADGRPCRSTNVGASDAPDSRWNTVRPSTSAVRQPRKTRRTPKPTQKQPTGRPRGLRFNASAPMLGRDESIGEPYRPAGLPPGWLTARLTRPAARCEDPGRPERPHDTSAGRPLPSGDCPRAGGRNMAA